MPWEIKRIIGSDVRITTIHGAVIPIFARSCGALTRMSSQIEKVAYYPPFNRFAHRIYYKAIAIALPHADALGRLTTFVWSVRRNTSPVRGRHAALPRRSVHSCAGYPGVRAAAIQEPSSMAALIRFQPRHQIGNA